MCECVDLIICIFIARNPPPRGAFFVGWFPNPEPGEKRPSLGVVLQGGSSSSRFLVWKPPNKETPPGGGVSFDQFVCICVCMRRGERFVVLAAYVCVYICVCIVCACVYVRIWFFAHVCIYVGVSGGETGQYRCHSVRTRMEKSHSKRHKLVDCPTFYYCQVVSQSSFTEITEYIYFSLM